MSTGNTFQHGSHSSAKLRRIAKVQFGVWSPDEIRSASVTKAHRENGLTIPEGVTKYETNGPNGRPNFGGVNDPRMGTTENKIRCKTCDGTYTGSATGEKKNDCPGHFGHIDLARPVYHIGFLKEVIFALRCVCFHCSRIMIDKNDFKFKRAMKIRNAQTRLGAMHELCRGKKQCGFAEKEAVQAGFEQIEDGGATAAETSAAFADTGCGGYQPRYTKDGLGIQIEYHKDEATVNQSADRKTYLSAEVVLNILKKITDADALALGFDPRWARPEWLLITCLPVSPPHVRPSVTQGAGMSHDDLTHQYINVIKANNSLNAQMQTGEPPHIIESVEKLLQFKVASLFDNECSKNGMQETQRSGKVLKTIRQRIKGKEGRIRGNLMGKRVDFSARTVITADPILSIDQVGVPRSVAMNLTFPERVTPFNINYLRGLVAKGPTEHPGAKFVIQADGNRLDLRYVRNRNDLTLEYGWIVERHLMDDDPIVFNRQPSLHKMSIMSHKVKVLDWSTFRLNLAVTSPYNADFDGDEMNLHVPQTLTARCEAAELMRVSKLVVSPQSNKPVMGIVQDSLIAVQRMTKRQCFIEKDFFFNILMWVKNWNGQIPNPAIVHPKPLWTGKQVFSLICPPINLKSKNNAFPKGNKPNTLNVYDGEVLIINGNLIHGIIDKKTVGSGEGGIIHTTWVEHGNLQTRDFMDAIQVVVNYWILNISLSIGIADAVGDKDVLIQVGERIEEAKVKVKELVQKGQDSRLKAQPGKSMLESFESMVNTVLNDARQKAGKLVQDALDDTNNVKAMVSAGSKGSDINISQIIACVGQQNVEGKRIAYGFRRRSLPHFRKDDLGPESRGFVANSYLRGLSAQEFYFHAMGGREGLIDTAVKTSTTGYLQRRLVKSMESVMVQYDSTVRNSQGNVVQFLFGEDGEI